MFINSASSVCAEQSVDILRVLETSNTLLKYLTLPPTRTALTTLLSTIASPSSVPLTSSASLITATSIVNSTSSKFATSSVPVSRSGGLHGKAEGAVVAGSALAGVLATIVLIFFCTRCYQRRKVSEHDTGIDLPEWRGSAAKSDAGGAKGDVEAVNSPPTIIPELEGSQIARVHLSEMG